MPNIKPYDLKNVLKDKGFSQVDIARMLKVHPVCVHEVIIGKRKNPRIRAAIAMAVTKSVSELWPETKAATRSGKSPVPKKRPADRERTKKVPSPKRS